MVGGQYSEDVLLLRWFKDQPLGFVVEIGAANGQDDSNSHCLIQKGWSGILIEPEPEQFADLQKFYRNRPDVVCVQEAADLESREVDFYCGEQVSTLCPVWRDRYVQMYGIDYKTIRVLTRHLGDILKNVKAPKRIDFLSVDCEGRDVRVLRSMDWDYFDVGLVCTEARCDPFMASVGFHFVQQTHPLRGNKFYGKGMAKIPD